jgi:hypothetical protein
LDGPQDVNLGFALTIWDQLFHTAVFPTKDSVRIDTGLPGRPLTVEQETSRPRHLAVLAAQLVAPFRPLGNRRQSCLLSPRQSWSGPAPDPTPGVCPDAPSEAACTREDCGVM